MPLLKVNKIYFEPAVVDCLLMIENVLIVLYLRLLKNTVSNNWFPDILAELSLLNAVDHFRDS